ncbi:hypothetical protein [Salirhabdus sp. Marseille-P4669]|uniref:hypothetical protein n=1 Tax=Salirhabdus sp. Marseille-P4669 TaxID=2042310 RepID=UPI000C7E691B|nr:hypothetical protein [Salirhabdus sp. Marseille-P4669]
MSKEDCHYCKKTIRDRDELITASRRFRVKPFHYKCFQQLEEQTDSQKALWIPVNGITGNITVLLMLAVAGWMFFTDFFLHIGDFIGVVALYPVVLRIYSFLFIERKLPKYDPNKKPLT